MLEVYYTVPDADGELEPCDEAVSVREAQQLIDSGVITSESTLWTDGMDDWLPLPECAGRFGLSFEAEQQ